jgi:hypothetical protein
VSKFRKKPVVVDAYQWHDGPAWSDVRSVWIDADGLVLCENSPCAEHTPEYHHTGWGLWTSRGWIVLSPGDWVVTDAKGEKSRCSPDIFEETYEPLPDWIHQWIASREDELKVLREFARATEKKGDQTHEG